MNPDTIRAYEATGYPPTMEPRVKVRSMQDFFKCGGPCGRMLEESFFTGPFWDSVNKIMVCGTCLPKTAKP